MMKRLISSLGFVAILLLHMGCGARQEGAAQTAHAEVVAAADGLVARWEHFVEGECPNLIHQADSIERVNELEQQCYRAGQSQQLANEIVHDWALAALTSLEAGHFDLQKMLPFAKRFVFTWQEAYDVFQSTGMPAMPDVILQFVGYQ